MPLKDNLEEVLEEIEETRLHSLTGEKVNLIAVSKNHPVEKINELSQYGCLDFGENKVQEIVDKIPLSKDNINYHMIGNLQSNKVKYIYDKVVLIQSIDRLKLVEEINKRAKKDDIFVNILIQVNISKEEQKGGVNIEDTLKFLESCLDYKNVAIKGLMGIAANTKNQSEIRSSFRSLFKLKEDIINRNYENVSMDYLSMGMSGDYKIAIEEGSNMVRIGTKIFGKREY